MNRAKLEQKSKGLIYSFPTVVGHVRKDTVMHFLLEYILRNSAVFAFEKQQHKQSLNIA